MGTSTPIKILRVGLTDEERQALDEIAATEDVSIGSIVRDLLAEKYPETFGAVSRHRTGKGGRPRATAT